MLDETLLDAPDDLALADRRGLLLGAAEAGARVRTAARHAAEAASRTSAPRAAPARSSSRAPAPPPRPSPT